MSKVALWLSIGILLAAAVQAATIHGTVYDIGLDPLKNAIVEIDTLPNQRMVAREGTYEFSVPKGEYRIKALYTEADGTALTTIEALIVKDDGAYVLDLFLFPDLEEEDEILQDIDMDVTEGVIEEAPSRKWIMYLAVIGIFIIVIIIFFKLLPSLRRLPSHLAKEAGPPAEAGSVQADLDAVLEIMRKHGGRMTQKDLRKELPLSEAKVSLMVAELEHQGKVKKIKKGRGNILVIQ